MQRIPFHVSGFITAGLQSVSNSLEKVMGCCSLNPTACSRVVGEFPRKLGLLQDNGEKPCIGGTRAAGNTPSTQVVKPDLETFQISMLSFQVWQSTSSSFSSYTIARQVWNMGFPSAAAAHCAQTLFYHSLSPDAILVDLWT